jgi:hypothetical protein
MQNNSLLCCVAPEEGCWAVMSQNVVYYRLISNNGLKSVLTATEYLGNKELYLRVDNLGYRKSV